MSPVHNSRDERNYEYADSAAEAPLLVEPTAGKFTQEQALDWLASHKDTGESVRSIAATWGWHRSRVSRFLARYRETASETLALSRSETGETPETSVSVAETPESPASPDFNWVRAEVLLPARTSVYAYVDQGTGDLWISASDARLCCDTQMRISADDVADFVDRLVELVEPAHRGQAEEH